jgi:histidinol phosphatase-like enzyme
MKKIIAIDFDGVIVPENFPHINGLMIGAKETIRDLYEAGYQLILWTARTNEYLDYEGNPGMYLDKAITFLKENDMLQYFASINSNVSDKYNCRKVYAHIFIDDRDINGFVGWDKVREILL